jgi:hypothetical protein
VSDGHSGFSGNVTVASWSVNRALRSFAGSVVATAAADSRLTPDDGKAHNFFAACQRGNSAAPVSALHSIYNGNPNQ